MKRQTFTSTKLMYPVFLAIIVLLLAGLCVVPYLVKGCLILFLLHNNDTDDPGRFIALITLNAPLTQAGI